MWYQKTNRFTAAENLKIDFLLIKKANFITEHYSEIHLRIGVLGFEPFEEVSYFQRIANTGQITPWFEDFEFFRF